MDRSLDNGDEPVAGAGGDLVREADASANARPVASEAGSRTAARLHARRQFVVETLAASLSNALGGGARRVRVQQPLALPQYAACPDICVLAEAEGKTSPRRGRPDPVELIVEVSSEHLPRHLDRLEAYAAAGIPEVWIVDLKGQRILIYRSPSGKTFSKRQLLVAPEKVPLPSKGSVEVGWIFTGRNN